MALEHDGANKIITDQVFHKDLKGWRGWTREFSRQAAAQAEVVKAEVFAELLYEFRTHV